MATSRTFNISQYEVNPKSGEDLHFNEENILECVSHRTIKKWAYICHDKDIATSEDEAQNDFKEGTSKPRHWHIVLKTDKAVEIDTIAKWLGIPSNFIDVPRGGNRAFLDCVQYLTHEDSKQQQMGKHLYRDDEVKSNFDFRKELDERDANIKKYGQDLSPIQQLYHDVLYSGKTIKECIEEDKILYMEHFDKIEKYRLEYIKQQRPPQGERIYKSLNLVDEAYIEESAPVIKAGGKGVWLKWAAVAACMCFVVGVAAFTVIKSSHSGGTVQEQLLAAIKSSGAMNTAARETELPIEGRIAVYEQIYVGSAAAVDTPDSPDSTEKLQPFVGDIYTQYGESSWYRVKGMDEIKYLISEDTAGTLRLWEYRSFLVMDGILATARFVTETPEDELAEIENSTREQFPDADLSPYTYGDVYRIIYNVESADDIVSITATPSRSNNTDFGKQIQKQVGTHTYDDRDSITLFYGITMNVVCNGATGWGGSNSERNRYTYSFSTDEDDKLTSGEETWASRYLTIALRSGTTIDSWKYTALSGRFYEFGGIFTEPLSETQVYEINSIFGIE